MRTIRGRIFIALIIVMVFSVSTTVYMVDRLIDGMLMDQARNQLRIQMEKGIQIIEGGDPEDLSSDDLELRFRDRMYYADFFILDKADKIIAAGDDEMIGRSAHISMNKRDHFFELNQEKMMYTHQNLKNGLRIVIYTPMDILNQVSDRILHLSIRSVIISFVVIFVVGLWLVWNTTRPLMKLKEAVSRFDPSYRRVRLPKGDHTEIGQLMDTFQSMSERIGRHHQQQTEFLQNISHELRTPLMSIQGYAEAIKDQVVSVEKGVDVVSKESKRLIQLVDKLLQLTRLETLDEAWKMTQVDVSELVEQAVQLLGPVAAERQVKIELQIASIEHVVPAEQIFQLIMNYLQNAVRYAASEVTVTLEQVPNGFRMIVDDDGPGVPIAERESVFERNYIGEAGMTGIGLAICKHIADKLQTKVECLESPQGGARFTFEYKTK
ncbi:sensor histidine kinase [Paenibacillus guangzhouensis]|uniref:sensor histidine kinase n=1 Tax=Paenibacillus guangzhouensis TaxID=1473112 RepID=UPI00126691C6|nr:HAMP domain-containing sensor histidine kinase [Paenibacillus guangzhouensis]